MDLGVCALWLKAECMLQLAASVATSADFIKRVYVFPAVQDCRKTRKLLEGRWKSK